MGDRKSSEMIASLDGILIYSDANSVIVRVGGVGFQINISRYTLNQLGDIGSAVSLYTYIYLRTDNVAMYGFATREELVLFKELITVSGIGPKIALALLSTMKPEQLVMAITSNNVEMIVQVPGIGKKVANRLIVELKGKLQKEWEEASLQFEPENAEAVDALTSLGYSLREATQLISSIPNSSELKLEEKIKLALQQLGAP
jgi:holliday junction DNA helicase RuvA